MAFPLRYKTETTHRHLENAIITTTENTAIRQVKRQGHARTGFLIKWNFSHGIHHRRYP